MSPTVLVLNMYILSLSLTVYISYKPLPRRFWYKIYLIALYYILPQKSVFTDETY